MHPWRVPLKIHVVKAPLTESLELMHVARCAGLAVTPVKIAFLGVAEQKRFRLEQHMVVVVALCRFQHQFGFDRGGQLVHINAKFGRKGGQGFVGCGQAAGQHQQK